METADVLRTYTHTVDTQPLNSEVEKRKKQGPDLSQVDCLCHLADKIRSTVM